LNFKNLDNQMNTSKLPKLKMPNFSINGQSSFSSNFIALIYGVLFALMVSGCGAINYQAGNRTNIDAFEKSSHIGKSTTSDIEGLLGQPFAKGRSLLHIQSSPREMWTYYFEKGVIDLGGNDTHYRRMMLFIYFDEGRYDGHMWFSSFPDEPIEP